MEPGRQFRQLDMFRPARDLVNPAITEPGDFPAAQRAEGWAQKLAQAKEPMALVGGIRRRTSGPSLHDNIRANGVIWPIELDHASDGAQVITNGHHRIAVAHDLSPDYVVPVLHREQLGLYADHGGAL